MKMAETKLAPLSTQVPIVDSKGNPTPYFQQLMQIFIDEKNAVADGVIENVEDLDDLAAVVAALELDDLADVDTTGVDHGSVLYKDSTAWQALAAGAAGKVLTAQGSGADPTWETPNAAGSWTLIGTGQTSTGLYDFAVDGAKATIDFLDLTGYQDLLLWMDGVTKSVSGGFQVQVSVNNGSSWYTASGDYVQVAATGAFTNTTSAGFHNTATTAARSQYIFGYLMGVANVPKTFYSQATTLITKFQASSSAVNALRFTPTAGGNINGGKVWVFGK